MSLEDAARYESISALLSANESEAEDVTCKRRDRCAACYSAHTEAAGIYDINGNVMVHGDICNPLLRSYRHKYRRKYIHCAVTPWTGSAPVWPAVTVIYLPPHRSVRFQSYRIFFDSDGTS